MIALTRLGLRSHLTRASRDFSHSLSRRPAAVAPPSDLLHRLPSVPARRLATLDTDPSPQHSLLTAFLKDAADSNRYSRYLLAELLDNLPDQRVTNEDLRLLSHPNMVFGLFGWLFDLAESYGLNQLSASLFQALEENEALQTPQNLTSMVRSYSKLPDAEERLRTVIGLVRPEHGRKYMYDMVKLLKDSEYWYLCGEVENEEMDELPVIQSLVRVTGSSTVVDESHVSRLLEAIGRDEDQFAAFMRVLREKNIRLSKPSVELITTWWRNGHGRRRLTMEATQSKGGVCQLCRRQMEVVSVSSDLVTALRDDLHKWLAGDPLKMYTTAKEMSMYRSMLDEQEKRGVRFDCVIDLLNCVYGRTRFYREEAIDYFFQLLTSSIIPKLGLKELLFVSKPFSRIDFYLAQLRKQLKPKGVQVKWFICSYSAKDDFFLVDAALWSGPSCYIISYDQLRQHSALVSDEQRAVFKQWQKARQIKYARLERRVAFPENVDDTVQGDKHVGWHIPYFSRAVLPEDVTTGRIEFIPKKWLCLSYSKSKR